MLKLRRANERGHANHGWLDTNHSFSFADYYDPANMGFGPLRVLNEDRVAPGKGFPPHSHRDMEIISYVLEGALEHKDSMGNGSIIRPGDVQRMSAGTGVTHSEYNASKSEPVHFLQIWIVPEKQGLPAGYEQKQFSDLRGQWRLVASPDGKDGSVTIRQNARLYAAVLAGETLTWQGSRGWLQVARGEAKVGDTSLAAGDGLAFEKETLSVHGNCEVLLFDLPV
jgi:redox-sensitive bicupin YhaK (pirin superfamily)